MASPFLIDAAYDAGLNYIKTNCVKLTLCSAEPTDYADATLLPDAGPPAGFMLAEVTVDSSDFTLDLNDGAGGGKMLTVASQSAVPILYGDPTVATHIALVTADTLIAHAPFVNTVNLDYGAGSNTTTIPSFTIRMQDVVAS